MKVKRKKIEEEIIHGENFSTHLCMNKPKICDLSPNLIFKIPGNETAYRVVWLN